MFVRDPLVINSVLISNSFGCEESKEATFYTRVSSLMMFIANLMKANARLSGEGIIGGDQARPGQFPYQVSLQVNGQSICGGGVIGERFVLTAAHCVTDDGGTFTNLRYKVVVGATDLSVRRSGRTLDAEKIYILNSYKPTSSLIPSDIAVIKTRQNIGLNRGVSKLDLPRTRATYAGQIAKISGYGYTWIQVFKGPWSQKKEGQGRTGNVLNYLDARILSHEECRRTTTYTPVLKTNICAQALQQYRGGKIRGICSGDSGGPLVVGNTVVGVVSTSPLGCEENEQAAVYTRVSSYVRFIDNVMNGRVTGDMLIREVGGIGVQKFGGYRAPTNQQFGFGYSPQFGYQQQQYGSYYPSSYQPGTSYGKK